MDYDGDMDVMSASNVDDTVAWYENTAGDGSVWTEHVITTAADNAWSVFATNIDNVGYLDVLSASKNDNKVAWYDITP